LLLVMCGVMTPFMESINGFDHSEVISDIIAIYLGDFMPLN
jgi:hypothetical protein